MKIEFEEAVSRFVTFMADNVAKVNDPVKRFLMYAALGAVNSNPAPACARFKGWLEAVGVVDADGMVCVDTAEEAFREAFAKMPKVTVAGFTFTQSDADALIDGMRG